MYSTGEYVAIFAIIIVIGIIMKLVLNGESRKGSASTSLKIEHSSVETNEADADSNADSNADSDEDEDMDKNMPNTFIDLLEDYYLNDNIKLELYADKLTKVCYYVMCDNMCPVYKSDGTIYTVDELMPLIKEAYKLD